MLLKSILLLVAFLKYLAILTVLVGGILERQGPQWNRDHGSVVALARDLKSQKHSSVVALGRD